MCVWVEIYRCTSKMNDTVFDSHFNVKIVLTSCIFLCKQFFSWWYISMTMMFNLCVKIVVKLASCVKLFFSFFFFLLFFLTVSCFCYVSFLLCRILLHFIFVDHCFMCFMSFLGEFLIIFCFVTVFLHISTKFEKIYAQTVQ